MKIVLATSNPGKVREIRRMLEGLDAELLSLDDFPSLVMPPEDKDTFKENALDKARAVASASGLPALADDSGLVVDALSGAPGVRSARYAGPGATDAENVEKLLAELAGVDDEKRTARFVCVAAYAEPGGLEVDFTGTIEGRITREPAGAGGFGYDPVFFVPELACTTAELTAAQKNAVSHRGKAIAGFRAWLEAGRGAQ